MVEGLGSLSLPLLEKISQAPSFLVTGGSVSGDAQCTDDVPDGEKMPEKMENHDDVRIEEMAPEKRETSLFGPSSASTCSGLSDVAIVASCEAEEGWEHVGRGRRSGHGASLEQSREGLERSLAFKSCAAGVVGDDDGWVHVGRGGRPGREPTYLLHEEGLECSLADTSKTYLLSRTLLLLFCL
jgi:hypothetical protein